MASKKFQQQKKRWKIYMCVSVCVRIKIEKIWIRIWILTHSLWAYQISWWIVWDYLSFTSNVSKNTFRFKKATTRVMRVVLKHLRVIVLPCRAIVNECPEQSGNRRREAQHSTSTRRVQFWLFQVKLNKLHARELVGGKEKTTPIDKHQHSEWIQNYTYTK